MTNNVQTPGGNTTTAGAVEMARRIADETSPRTNIEDVLEAALNGAAYRSALAAIIETQERDAELVERFPIRADFTKHDTINAIAANIRSDRHLKGPKP